jgi:hypothetical protein
LSIPLERAPRPGNVLKKDALVVGKPHVHPLVLCVDVDFTESWESAQSAL